MPIWLVNTCPGGNFPSCPALWIHAAAAAEAGYIARGYSGLPCRVLGVVHGLTLHVPLMEQPDHVAAFPTGRPEGGFYLVH